MFTYDTASLPKYTVLNHYKCCCIECRIAIISFQDVAEDMYDAKTSTEAISRRRQRNEICVTLKRSSIIHDVYIGKNCVKVAIIFLTQ